MSSQLQCDLVEGVGSCRGAAIADLLDPMAAHDVHPMPGQRRYFR